MKKCNKKLVFTGAAVAIVTPFDKNGNVDYEAYDRLIEFQIENHTDAIVTCGTTGESATLTFAEHCELVEHTVKTVAGRVPVIAGTGSNSTAHATELSIHAEKAGADALLCVTPYYNKATQAGLVKHFSAIANSVKIPVILYNVPSRTGCNITVDTYKELAKIENIVATKEASGNLSQIAQIADECGDSLYIYSGNDDQITPILSLGGKGVISVLSNVIPQQAHDIAAACLNGDVQRSAQLQLEYLRLANDLFLEVNPIPVKTALGYMGLCLPDMRLPLCEMGEKNAEKLLKTLKEYGLVK